MTGMYITNEKDKAQIAIALRIAADEYEKHSVRPDFIEHNPRIAAEFARQAVHCRRLSEQFEQ